MSPDDSEVAPSLLRAMIREQSPNAPRSVQGVDMIIELRIALRFLCRIELQNVQALSTRIKLCSSVLYQCNGWALTNTGQTMEHANPVSFPLFVSSWGQCREQSWVQRRNGRWGVEKNSTTTNKLTTYNWFALKHMSVSSCRWWWWDLENAHIPEYF